MLEKSFLRAEESYLTPPEYDDDDGIKICECCDSEIPKGDYFWIENNHILCEGCMMDKIYDVAEIA
ncbi:MAG: hypothetical protein HFE57_09590 [Firmicutes bacterium]|jgi:hypothetical protein|nr:hypothetical protein [Bacillota bacterium]